MKFRKTLRWVAIAAVSLVVYLLFFACIGMYIPGTDMVFYLAFGWIGFLARVIPQVRVNWGAVGSGAVYISILLTGAHCFLRWLHREMKLDAAPAWRFPATARLFGIIFLMFLVGMAAIGVAHQTAWLITSPEPLYYRYNRYDQSMCGYKLRNIAAALLTYANAHGGQYPDNLGELCSLTDFSPSVLICPASNDKAVEPGADGKVVPSEILKPGHCSYLYFGRGVATNAPSETVLVAEPLDNHRGKGINVLYNDMHVEWLATAYAEKLLASLATKPPTTATTQPATRP